jgi:hypothetical protein
MAIGKRRTLRDPGAVQDIYQQADDATMLQVVLGAGELREAK